MTQTELIRLIESLKREARGTKDKAEKARLRASIADWKRYLLGVTPEP